MVELGLAKYFGMGEAVGIIATFFVITYFSRKQMQSISVDVQTKVLNDLGWKGSQDGRNYHRKAIDAESYIQTWKSIWGVSICVLYQEECTCPEEITNSNFVDDNE